MVTPSALVVLFVALAVAVGTRNVFVAGRRTLGWLLAAVVAASVIAPAVEYLSRHMKRGFALVLVLIPLAAGTGLVTKAVYTDLDSSVVELKTTIPEAARNLENDKRLGGIAKKMDLHSRATEAVENLKKPTSSVADHAMARGSSYLVISILTIFLLIFGPRYIGAAARQITDTERRERVSGIVGAAFRRSQGYVGASLVQALAIGVVAWSAFKVMGIPAPTPLALVLAVLSLVPVVGTLFGSVPAVLVIAGEKNPLEAAIVFAVVIALQVGQILLLRVISDRTLYVGPAVIGIAALVGLAMYGLGGAIFLTAVAVFGVALIDARAETVGDEMLPADALPIDVRPVPDTGSG